MRRREFISLFGGAVTAWPLAIRAQKPERRRLIGVVAGMSDTEMRPLIDAFREKLKTLGWKDDNITIDVRLGSGDFKRMTEEARRLIRRSPDVILVQGSPALAAVRHYSQSAPVVFVMIADPVRLGLIESLAHPGGYTTGFTNFEFSIGSKWLALLREIEPHLTHVTLIANPGNPSVGEFSRFIENAGHPVGVDIVVASVHNPAEIEAAINATAQQPGGGLIILPDSLALVNRDLIIGLTKEHRLPAVYPFRVFPSHGGLISYGLHFPAAYRQAATYVDRVLRGEKPADLPVQAPTKFELVINLKTAKALGLSGPSTLLASADEVIE